MDPAMVRMIRHKDVKVGMTVVPYNWLAYWANSGGRVPQGTVVEVVPCDCPDSATAGPILRVQWDEGFDRVVEIRHAGYLRRVVTPVVD